MQIYLQDLPVKFVYQGYRSRRKSQKQNKVLLVLHISISAGFRQGSISPLCSWVVCLQLKNAILFCINECMMLCWRVAECMYRFAAEINPCRCGALTLLLYVLMFNFSVMIVTIYVLKPQHSYALADAIDTSPPTLCMFTTFKLGQKKMPVFHFYDVISSK